MHAPFFHALNVNSLLPDQKTDFVSSTLLVHYVTLLRILTLMGYTQIGAMHILHRHNI
jgi:hypothetical protein